MRDLDRHVDAGELEKYSMGSATPRESTVIEEHLLTCEDCQERLRETDEYVLTLRLASKQVRRDEEKTRARVWSFPRWFPALAAVACGVLLVVLAQRFVRPVGPMVSVSLTALRGSGTGGKAPSGRPLELHPDLTGLPEAPLYRTEIVDLRGRTLRQGTLGRKADGTKFRGLEAGQYFVRVYLPAGVLLREYGLEIQ